MEKEEFNKVIFEWNNLKQDIPPVCVHDLVSEQAKKTPSTLAVTFEKYNEGLTYFELENLSNQVAYRLIEMNIKPQELVGLCMKRSVEMVVGILGIMKAGGVYVPLDPQFPRDRLTFMIEDASIKIILTSSDLSSFARNLVSNPQDIQLLFVDNIENSFPYSNDTSSHSLPKVDPNDLAYVLYTSGSTGKSKGVLLEHKGVVNFLLSMIKIPGFTSKDVAMACTTICFDISILEIFCPLIVGGTCIIIGEETRIDRECLVSLIDSLPITVLQATPSLWKLLFEFNWKGKKGLRALCGGEPLSINLANQLLEVVDELWNMYGPTETTIWSTIEKINQSLSSLPPIGKPIHNNYCYILNSETLQPVPIGEEGELYIGGVQLARGYHNRPELTAERFLSNPFLPNEKIYKTGDLAKYREDGHIIWLGRADFQVKINGNRVELGEIESLLDQHPFIKENIVSPYQFGEDIGLVAYIILQFGQTLTKNEIQEYLRKFLPFYMIPSFFVFLDSMPLLPNGKVDRKALPDPRTDIDKLDSTEVETLTKYEKRLIEICQNLLNVDSIKKKDNLFLIGGNSLFAIRLRNIIQNEFKIDIPSSEILIAKNVEELALKMMDRVKNKKSQLFEFITMTHGPGIPIYFIHPAGGFIFPYFRLTQSFEGCVPIIGIQDLSIHKNTITDTSKKIESMAQVYVDRLLEINPYGPYRLAGWSMGFFVALEMAQRLKTLEKQVEILINFDQGPNDKFSKLDFWINLVSASYLFKDGTILHSKAYLKVRSGIMTKFWKALNFFLALTTKPEDDFLKNITNSGMFSDGSIIHLLKLLACHRKAMISYVPSSYDGKVIVFQSSQNKQNLEKLWSKLLPNATYYTVSGNHYNIFAHPNNHEIEKRIKNALHIYV